jgi:hypothetical protein
MVEADYRDLVSALDHQREAATLPTTALVERLAASHEHRADHGDG